MRKVIKYVLCAVISIAAIVLVSKYVRGVYADGMNKFEQKINAEVEAKRAELIETGVFHEGVTVNGVAIGGMTFDEAKHALTGVEKELVEDVGFEIKYDGVTKLVIDKSYFTITYDTEEVLGEAIMLASEGEYEELRQQIDDIAENGRAYEISFTVTADEFRIADDIREVGDSLFVEPVNAHVEPNYDSVTDGSDRFLYFEGEYGYIAKTEEAVEETIERARNHAYGTVYMEGTELEPDIKVEDLEGKIVMRATYFTPLSGSYARESRVRNIEKACGMVNGTVLPPMDPDNPSDKSYIFSCEETLGPRTLELGWLLAPGFINGGANSKDSPGGGVCQVSSTLYNTAICSDLKIVYRQNHSAHVGYVPWGQDATIDTGKIDFKFANNTEEDLYIFMWVDRKTMRVHCEMWGQPFPDTFDEIRFYAELVEEIVPPAEPVIIRDSSLAYRTWYVSNRAKTGYKYQSYKVYYKNGRPITEPKEVALSTYTMHPKRIHVWASYDPAVDYLDPAYQVAAPHTDD